MDSDEDSDSAEASAQRIKARGVMNCRKEVVSAVTEIKRERSTAELTPKFSVEFVETICVQ